MERFVLEQPVGSLWEARLAPWLPIFTLRNLNRHSSNLLQRNRHVSSCRWSFYHRTEEPENFLAHINTIHSRNQFTMEGGRTTRLRCAPYEKRSSNNGHRVFRKSTRSDRYLYKESNHRLEQKLAVI